MTILGENLKDENVPGASTTLILLSTTLFEPIFRGNELSCVNCSGPVDPTEQSNLLFCSDFCRDEAKFVRYVRKALWDRRAKSLDIQEAIGTKLLMLYQGGYPSERKMPLKLREEIMVRDGYTCRICGAPATDIDHIYGSSNDPGNLQALCKDCNGRKMEKNAKTVSPDTDFERWNAIKSQENRLARRTSSPVPLQLSDSEEWGKAWRKLTNDRKQWISEN